jgi:hypothetical protein
MISNSFNKLSFLSSLYEQKFKEEEEEIKFLPFDSGLFETVLFQPNKYLFITRNSKDLKLN